jgi:uncharacterized protein with FMN-binding domain
MKQKLKLISIIVLSALAGCAVFGRAASRNNAVGLYEGSAQGYRGIISVQVGMTGGRIEGIDIVRSEEDESVGLQAMLELLELVLLYNTTDVDAVSGATESSVGFLKAVENAIMGHE